MWDFKPWDNDSAADWFGGFMDESNLRKHWLSGINEDPLDDPGAVRAAASIYIMLGRVYVWPIDHLDDDLELAIRQLKRTMDCEEYKEVPELIELIQSEVIELESRRKPKAQNNENDEQPHESKPWWKFW